MSKEEEKQAREFVYATGGSPEQVIAPSVPIVMAPMGHPGADVRSELAKRELDRDQALTKTKNERGALNRNKILGLDNNSQPQISQGGNQQGGLGPGRVFPEQEKQELYSNQSRNNTSEVGVKTEDNKKSKKD